MDDPPVTELEILRRCLEKLAMAMPPGWGLIPTEYPAADDGMDAVVGIEGPTGEAALFGVEIKANVERRDVERVIEKLEFATARHGWQKLVVARYFPASVRQALVERAGSYIDATGNMSISAASPAILLRDRGADANPWRGKGRPAGDLKGEPAAKIVRALVGSSKSWSISELVTAAQTSVGAAYRVLRFLQDEEFVRKDAADRYQTVDWARLLYRWSQDYSFMGSNRTCRYIEPHGVDALLRTISRAETEETLERQRMKYAVTGSIAAAQWAPYARVATAAIYVDDVKAAAARWRLREADAGTNVILAEPRYRVALKGTWKTREGYRAAAAPQVAVDLLTGPGRNPSEGAELIDWMKAHEVVWRR